MPQPRKAEASKPKASSPKPKPASSTAKAKPKPKAVSPRMPKPSPSVTKDPAAPHARSEGIDDLVLHMTRDEAKALYMATAYITGHYGPRPDPPTPAMTVQAKLAAMLEIALPQLPRRFDRIRARLTRRWK